MSAPDGGGGSNCTLSEEEKKILNDVATSIGRRQLFERAIGGINFADNHVIDWDRALKLAFPRIITDSAPIVFIERLSQDEARRVMVNELSEETKASFPPDASGVPEWLQLEPGQTVCRTHCIKFRKPRWGMPLQQRHPQFPRQPLTAHQAWMRGEMYRAPFYVNILWTRHWTPVANYPAETRAPAAWVSEFVRRNRVTSGALKMSLPSLLSSSSGAAAKTTTVVAESPCPGPAFHKLLTTSTRRGPISETELARFKSTELYAAIRANERAHGTLVDVDLERDFERFRFPVMTGSFLDWNCAPVSAVAGTDAGFFIMPGSLRILPPNGRNLHNDWFIRGPSSHARASIEMRPQAITRRYHSTPTINMSLMYRVPSNPLSGTQVVVSLNLVTVPFFVVTLYVALGRDPADFYDDVRAACPSDDKWIPRFDTDIRSMVMTAMCIQSSETALELFARGVRRIQAVRLPTSTAAANITTGTLTEEQRKRKQAAEDKELLEKSKPPSSPDLPFVSETGAKTAAAAAAAAAAVDTEAAAKTLPERPAATESDVPIVEKLTKAEMEHGIRLLNHCLLPQIGTSGTPEINREKSEFLALMVYTTLALDAGFIAPTNDQSDIARFRFYPAGEMACNKLRQVHDHDRGRRITSVRRVAEYNANVREHGFLNHAALGVDPSLLSSAPMRAGARGSTSRYVRQLPTASELFIDNYMTARFQRCFGTPDWSVSSTSFSRAYGRTDVTREPNQNNRLGFIGEFMRATSPFKAKGNNERARSLHGSHWGFQCAYDNPHGRGFGLSPALALGVCVSLGIVDADCVRAFILSNAPKHLFLTYSLSSAARIGASSSSKDDACSESKEEKRSRDPSVTVATSTTTPVATKTKNAVKKRKWVIMLEGRVLGFTQDATAFAEWVRSERRKPNHHVITRELSISIEPALFRVLVRCDAGRLLRPLLRFSHLGLLREWARPDRADRFPTLGATTLHSLAEKGVVEFLDPAEIASPCTIIAMHEGNALQRARKTPSGMRFTHMELDPAARLSLSSGMLPLIEKSPAARAMFGGNLSKHSVGLDPERRSQVKPMHEMWTAQKPICSTATGRRAAGGAGLIQCVKNITVGVMVGDNADDATQTSQRLSELNAFTSSTYRSYRSTAPAYAPDAFAPFDPRRVAGGRDSDFSLVQHAPLGIPPVGATIKPNTVVIRRSLPLPTLLTLKQRAELRRHRDFLAAGGSPRPDSPWAAIGIDAAERLLRIPRRQCDSVVATGPPAECTESSAGVNASGCATRRVGLTYKRQLRRGDKLSSRHAQKGVAASVTPEEDVYTTYDGSRLGLLINPAAFPSRNTNNYLDEMLLGKAIAFGASPGIGDVTSFRSQRRTRESTRKEIIRALQARGLRSDGSEIVICPRTGEPLLMEIMVGEVAYLKQWQMAADQEHARGPYGPVEFITKQGTQGRARNGCQRLGDMEFVCLIASQAANFISARLDASDKWRSLICKRCRGPFGHQLWEKMTQPKNIHDSSKDQDKKGGDGHAKKRRKKREKREEEDFAPMDAPKGEEEEEEKRQKEKSDEIEEEKMQDTNGLHCDMCKRGDAVVAVKSQHSFRVAMTLFRTLGINVTIDVAAVPQGFESLPPITKGAAISEREPQPL